MFKKYIAIFILLLTGLTIHAQDLKYCSTTEMWEEAIKHDPSAAERNAQLREFTKRFASHAERTAGGTMIYTIPVVFHVIHTYGSENISKAQIQSAVDMLNLSFRKLNPDTVDVIPLFQPIQADCEIQFRLANIDPAGNCTDGITRTFSNLTNSAGDNVKALIQWNNTKYMNVWVVKNIASGAAGYAYYPGISGSIDGIVIRHDYVGSFGTSNGSNYVERSLTHEVGHWLDLPHTWGNSNTPGLSTNCNIDDGIMDTPNTKGTSSGCNTAQNTCGQIDNVQNYMDYASCHLMFTEGQRDQMHGALNGQPGSRYNLWDPANLLATGTEDNHVTTNCAPRADFDNDNYQICAGSSITFNDASWRGEVLSRQWIFNGGSPATDTAASVAVTYANPGTYDVTLIVTSAGGVDTLTRTANVNVIPASSPNGIPYNEGFETLPALAGSEWAVENPNNNNTWTINNLAAATGTYSVRLQNNTGNGSGSVDGLITPSFNLTGVTGASLNYKMAFAPKVTSDTSGFKIYVSNNCGRTWILRSNRYGSVLHTGTPNFAGNWTPLASQWRQETLSLLPYSNQANIRVKFEFINHNGNNFYLDDINISGTVGLNDLNASIYQLEVYPNPAAQQLNITMKPERSVTIAVELTDLAGRVVYAENAGTVGAGEFRYAIRNNGQYNGMYILRINAGGDLMQTPVIFRAD